MLGTIGMVVHLLDQGGYLLTVLRLGSVVLLRFGAGGGAHFASP